MEGHHVPALGRWVLGAVYLFSKDNSTFMYVLYVCLGLTQKLKDLILVGHAGRYPNPVNLVTVLFQMFIVLFKLLWARVCITYGLNKCNAVLLCLAEMQKSLQWDH